MRLDVDRLRRLAILATNSFATRDLKDRVKRRGGELRGDLDWSHSPNMLICNDAVADALLFDVPIEQTVLESQDTVRFCAVSKQSGKAERMVVINEGTEVDLPKSTRWYRAKDSQRRIETRFPGNRRTTPTNARGIAICQDLPEELPDDIDKSWYLAQARRKFQKIRGYRHRRRSLLQGEPAATKVLDLGLFPVPKNGKALPSGADPRNPTLLWDWRSPYYSSTGVYTGPAVHTLVVDIDKAEKFKQFVDKDNSPLFNDRWKTLETALVSFHGSATAEGVRSGRDRHCRHNFL